MPIGYPEPQLTDETVLLRPWTFDDLGCVEEASTDARIPAGTTVPARYTHDEGHAFVERQWSRVDNGEGISLAIHLLDEERAVGLIVAMLRPQPGVIGLGYWVVPSARRHRCATRAVALVGRWAIEVAGFARAEAWVEPDNLASQTVLTGAGFEQEGRLRSFLTIAGQRSDVFVYSRIGRMDEG